MPNDLIKYTGGTLDIGVDTFNPDFTRELALNIEEYNFTSGIQVGMGPRYGITPIPGQSDYEDPSTQGDRTNGIMRSEINQLDVGASIFRGLTNRKKAMRLHYLKLRTPGTYDVATAQQTFTTNYENVLFLVCAGDKLDDTGSGIIVDPNHQFFDVIYQAKVDDTPTNVNSLFTYLPDLQYGFERSWVLGTVSGSPRAGFMSEFCLDYGSTPAAQFNKSSTDLFLYDLEKYYASSATFTKPSKKIPMKWFAGHTATGGGVGDATHAPNIYLTETGAGTGFFSLNGGVPSSIIYGEMSAIQRGILVYTFAASGAFNILYSYSTSLQTLIPVGIVANTGTTAASSIKFETGGVAATKLTAGTTYTDNIFALINDSDMVTDCGFNAIFVPGNKPVAMVIQEWTKSKTSPRQYFDLSLEMLKPRVFDLGNSKVPSAQRYQEGGYPKNTSFYIWPSFIRGTPMAAGTNGAALGGADTGILRSDTVYEITYSYYNKRLDFESNVGVPVKVQTGTNDNICILISNSTGTRTQGQNMGEQYGAGAANPQPAIWNNFAQVTSGSSTALGLDCNHFMNFTEIRFYYREEGTFEWLPAGNFDAAEFWLRPNPADFARICAGPVAGLPGGQPGGYNDYSPLPQGNYRCVLTFQNRVVWISAKTLNFSYRDNPFAYALRNSATVQTGEYLGAIVHNYPGESQQTSRLIVFATNAVYVGRFTGTLVPTAIRISADTVAEYPLDGSDFIFDLWTTITAFSHRAAVVAEGTLYYWGPEGVYRDNGTANPDRISKMLEPNIFSLYDKTKQDQIFCIYNNQTREIIWFFSPVDDPTITHALIYNINDEAFLFQRFRCKIDDASVIPISGDNSSTFGQQRTVVSVRESDETNVQRMFFFDYLNRSGDMTTGNELMVKTVATPVTGQRRFTFAAGSDTISDIAVGDTVCIQQLNKYWADTEGEDFLGRVTAVNNGSSYIDVLLPDGVTFDSSASLNYDEYFPVMQRAKNGVGKHGIPFLLSTKYWMPGGINISNIWLYIYMLFKYVPLPKIDPNSFSISYRTPSGGDFITDSVDFVDNSDGNFQLYHPLEVGERNDQGQAIKLKISGVQIGEEWVLQYLEAHCTEETGNFLKEYEG